jgi:hypothetical protein
MPQVKHIPYDLLKSYLRYEPDTGKFFWTGLVRKSHQGREAGSIAKDGYRVILLHKKIYTAGRVAWVLTHGDIDETKQIDHINRVRDDNRLANLRLVTQAVNSMNRGEFKYYSKTSYGKFQVKVRGRYIGLARTEEEAKEMVSKNINIEGMP